MIRVGNASAPRWYTGRFENLDAYIEQLVSFGATATELVLHHGYADDRIAGVHILQPDWSRVAGRFHAHGLQCNLHASLSPAFSLRRWTTDRRQLQSRYRPLIKFGEDRGVTTGEPVVMVIHAANATEQTAEANARATFDFLTWAIGESTDRGGHLRFAVELRHDPEAESSRFDTERHLLRRFVDQFGSDRVGVCWDIGNDVQRFRQHGAQPQPPDASFLRHVNHVHTHSHGRNDEMHYPLRSAVDPTVAWLGLLSPAGYDGSVTMEIRYKLARACGDPMTVLRESYATVLKSLGEPGNADSSDMTGD